MSHCSRCHRPISNPISIARGMGPVCASRISSSGTGIVEQGQTYGKNVATDIFFQGIVSSIYPPIGLYYSIFKIVKVGYGIYSHMEQKNHRSAGIEMAKFASARSIEIVSNQPATRLARTITMKVESSSFLNDYVVNNSLYSRILEGSVKTFFISSVGNFAKFSIVMVMS